MVLPSGETSTESHVPWSVLNSTLREGLNGRGWSFLASAAATVAWSLPCGGFWDVAKEANGSDRAAREMIQFDRTVFLRGFISSPPEQEHRVGLLHRSRQRNRKVPARNSGSTARGRRNCTPGLSLR